MFDHIKNWKLKEGSHEFPGPDGGTCINEAAIVAAGFEYKSVNSSDDLPRCFSKVACGFAIALNDHMLDHRRQELMPFVMKFSGSADSFWVEEERRNAIYGVLLSYIYRMKQKELISDRVENTLVELVFPSDPTRKMTPGAAFAKMMDTIRTLPMTYRQRLMSTSIYPKFYAEPFYNDITDYYTVINMNEQVLEMLTDAGIKALSVALAIGNQAKSLDAVEVNDRFEAIKAAVVKETETV